MDTVFRQGPAALGPWEASWGVVLTGALTARPCGGEGGRWPPGPRRKAAGRAPARLRGRRIARSLLHQRGVGKGGTPGLWKETHGPGPADVRLIFFFPDSKDLTTKVECLVGRRGEAGPSPPARRLHAVRLQPAPLPAG